MEKLLLVTSTVAPAESPPERPALASLPPVNENPPTPAATPAPARPAQVCIFGQCPSAPLPLDESLWTVGSALCVFHGWPGVGRAVTGA